MQGLKIPFGKKFLRHATAQRGSFNEEKQWDGRKRNGEGVKQTGV